MSERIDRGGWDDEEEDPPVTPLSSAQAQALRERYPQVSPWYVVAAQAAFGVVASAVAWGLFGPDAGRSALYGAIVIVVPTALLASRVGRLAGTGPVAGALGFLVWQGLKMLLSLVLLLAAVKVVPGLNWPALLVAMVVCLQVNWLALLWRREKR